METQKEEELYRLAKKRVSFKRHLGTYIIVNLMFWCIWYFSGEREENEFPWPVWPMLGWGIGLAFEFMGAYVYPKSHAVDREYEKLKNKQS